MGLRDQNSKMKMKMMYNYKDNCSFRVSQHESQLRKKKSFHAMFVISNIELTITELLPKQNDSKTLPQAKLKFLQKLFKTDKFGLSPVFNLLCSHLIYFLALYRLWRLT